MPQRFETGRVRKTISSKKKHSTGRTNKITLITHGKTKFGLVVDDKAS